MTSETFIPNSFQTPNGYVDKWMSYLTPEEFKILIYAARRIFGFQKRRDRISLSQFENGLTSRDGTILDHGTGMNRKALKRAIAGLINSKLLLQLEEGRPDHTPALYSLQLDPELVNVAFLETRKILWDKRDRGRIQNARAVLAQRTPTDTLPEQGPSTDPVQGPPTEGDRTHPQTPQKTEKKRENNKVSLLSFFSSLEEEEKQFLESMKGLPLEGDLPINQCQHWIKRFRDYGPEKVNDYLAWCSRQGYNRERAFNIDRKYNKVEVWEVAEGQQKKTDEIDWGHWVRLEKNGDKYREIWQNKAGEYVFIIETIEGGHQLRYLPDGKEYHSMFANGYTLDGLFESGDEFDHQEKRYTSQGKEVICEYWRKQDGVLYDRVVGHDMAEEERIQALKHSPQEKAYDGF